MDDACTYIIETESKTYSGVNECYCGKTNNIKKRLLKHKNEKYPFWFNNDKRRKFINVFVINGKFEYQIKRAGVRMIATLLKNYKGCSHRGQLD